MSRLPGLFDLQCSVAQHQDTIRSAFAEFDRGQILIQELDQRLQGCGVFLTRAYFEAKRRPPFTLAKLLHSLRVPDPDRHEFAYNDPRNFSGQGLPNNTAEPRRYSEGQSCTSEPNRVLPKHERLMPSETPIEHRLSAEQWRHLPTRKRIQMMFRDLSGGLVSASYVQRELINMGIEVDDARSAAILHCELGGPNAFRDLIIAFHQQHLLPDADAEIDQLRQQPIHAETDCRPRAGIIGESSAPSKSLSSASSRTLHTCEKTHGDIITWYGSHDLSNKDILQPPPEFHSSKARTCFNMTSCLRQNGMLGPNSSSSTLDSHRRPHHRPIRQPRQHEAFSYSHLELQQGGDSIAEPPLVPPDQPIKQAPDPLEHVQKKEIKELEKPFGTDKDVNSSSSHIQPFRSKQRRYQSLIQQCRREVAMLSSTPTAGEANRS